VRWWPNPSGS